MGYSVLQYKMKILIFAVLVLGADANLLDTIRSCFAPAPAPAPPQNVNDLFEHERYWYLHITFEAHNGDREDCWVGVGEAIGNFPFVRRQGAKRNGPWTLILRNRELRFRLDDLQPEESNAWIAEKYDNGNPDEWGEWIRQTSETTPTQTAYIEVKYFGDDGPIRMRGKVNYDYEL